MLLQKLSEAAGISGREEEVRAVILEEIRDRVDACRIDSMGNLIALKKGSGASALRVLVAAHMDEVGLMITSAEDSGMLRFSKVGGIDDRVLPARVVLIGPKRVPGVIGMKPVHLLEKADRDHVMESRQLSIDVGATGKGEAEKIVARGEFAVFATEFRQLAGEPGGRRTVQGKAFDDRAGCAILAELLTERFPFDLVAAFTVQEELECTGANEVPTTRDTSPSTRLGSGPAITIRDTSFIADPRLVELFGATAQEKSIPHQFKQPNIGGTDAGSIHRAREGIPSLTVAVPARYIHSPASIIDLDDFENTTALAREALHRLPRAFAQ
jgi:endoglucanase